MTKYIFKTIFCFKLFITVSKPTSAQYVSIPDPELGMFLQSFTSCYNGLTGLLDTVCASTFTYGNVTVSGVSDFYGIQFLNIDTLNIYETCYNGLDTLKNIPDFKTLTFSDNYCPTFDPFPEGINSISISMDFALTSIPNFPSTLVNFAAEVPTLSSIPAFAPSSLRSLYLYETILIPALPLLPNELTILGTSIQQPLPVLPDSLRELICPGTGISVLPTLPDSLEVLSCRSNNLTQLPSLPSKLKQLYCSNNFLTSLPPLPPNLNLLEAKNNSINSIPNFPAKLYYVELSDNNLNSLPSFPDSLEYLKVENNPNLSCLPAFNNVSYILISNTSIACLPQVKPLNVYIDVTGLPLCGLFNTNGCDFYWNLGGKSYLDKDSNCLPDTISSNLKNLKIKLADVNDSLLQLVFTNQDGAYSFDTDALGLYKVKVDTNGLPFTIVCPHTAEHTSTLSLADSLELDLDFAFECKESDLVVNSIFTDNLRPGDTEIVYNFINEAAAFYGVNCSSGISGEVKIVLDGPVSYAYPSSNSLTPTFINGDTIIYQVADFNQTIDNNSFCFYINVDTLAQLNDTVCISALVTSNGNEQNINNNYLSNCFPIVNSYDPNDKNAFPQTYIDKSGDGWINYTIRFQNTGTAEAINIYVTDTIDASLDISSFEILATSHDHITQILQNNVVKFNFPNINLPDSISDEPGSHGFIQYRIKIKDSLAVGLTINNTANIYFDFNPPVITNTISNSVINCAIPETQINATICDGNDFIFDGLTYTNSGNYKRSYVTNVGCDSTINLSINVIGGGNGFNLNRNGNTLSTTLGASSYQWINCNTGLPIPGATGPSYTVLNSGYYSLYISNGICADTSDCFYFSLTGINEISNNSTTVFPNPFSNEFTVKTNDSKLYELQFFDQQGKMIEKKIHQNETILDTKDLSSGLYYIRLINKENVSQIKVLKL